jgi:hypothetical protein
VNRNGSSVISYYVDTVLEPTSLNTKIQADASVSSGKAKSLVQAAMAVVEDGIAHLATTTGASTGCKGYFIERTSSNFQAISPSHTTEPGHLLYLSCCNDILLSQ